jgi:uracil DNA glycosylase
MSCAKIGWESFTEELVKKIDKKGVVFMLWGAPAQ